MKYPIYEILVRGRADGTISGSHVRRFTASGDPGHAEPLGTDGDVQAAIGELLPAALAAQQVAEESLEAERAARAAEAAEAVAYREAAEAAIKAAGAAIEDPNLDDTATVAAVAEVVKEISMPVKERQRNAIEAEIERLKAQAAAM